MLCRTLLYISSLPSTFVVSQPSLNFGPSSRISHDEKFCLLVSRKNHAAWHSSSPGVSTALPPSRDSELTAFGTIA